MAAAEKHAWGSLIALGAVYWYFQMRMLNGWIIVDTPPMKLLWLYITVVVLSIIAESIVAAIIANKKTGDIEKDERDHFIESRANRAEHIFLIAAINIFLFHIIADQAYANHIFPRTDLTNINAVVFILFTLLFVGEGIKRAFTIYYYRFDQGR